MKIIQSKPMAEFTTFKIGGPARYFCTVKNEKGVVKAVEFAKENKQKIFVLGGGSNVLISDKGFFGLVIKMEIKGVDKAVPDAVDPNIVYVESAAGEMWDEFVEKMVKEGLYGVENLSAIPGTVGAAPIQNIGAYGSDISETVESVRAFDTTLMTFVELSNKECGFEYRDSNFKKNSERYVVTKVKFRLRKNGKINISYRDLKSYFAEKSISDPSLEQVRDAVIEIRWNKLPNWKLWGTAGSFFKNPIIADFHYDRLKKEYPDMPGYPEPDGRIKIPLGWILDKVCDMRGVCAGNVCTYDKQALVLVTKPGATAEEVVGLANQIIDTVKQKTGIEIEGEVEWVN